MTKTQKTQQVSPAAKQAADLLLLLRKPITKIKIPTSSSTVVTTALLLHKRLNLDDNDDGENYPVEILCSFLIRKKKMALVHFVGYTTDYDRILPMSSLRNFRG